MNTTATTATEILGELGRELGAIFDRMGWAEDEIAQAQARHPEHADRIYHAFSLLSGGQASERMGVETVYRAHVREILERVAAGEDTRPGTAIEVVIGLLAAAERAPLSHEGFGLCARLWAVAGLPENEGFTARLGHLEALHADRLDREEAEARRACSDDDRRLGRIICEGMHHGAKVACSYTA